MGKMRRNHGRLSLSFCNCRNHNQISNELLVTLTKGEEQQMLGSPRKIIPKKSSPKRKSNTLQDLFDLDSKNAVGVGNNNCSSYVARSVVFKSENEEILTLISNCSLADTDHRLPESPDGNEDLRRLNLMKLLCIIKSSENPLPIHVLRLLLSLISGHLFRPLPPPAFSVIAGVVPEDDDLLSAPSAAWPTLQVVYDILSHLLGAVDGQELREAVDRGFLLNLLSLFQSEDPRERERLKNVFHRMYSKLTFHRSFMRKAMNEVFLHYMFDSDQRHSGIGELLEIWGSIINGFNVPLKEEHKLFLARVLIPLHKPKSMQLYHRQLCHCVSQFLLRDPLLAEMVVRGILRYWPVTNCQKEVLLIGELEELVEIINPDQYRKLALPLCTKIARCLNSCNSQVAERAIYVWNNEQFVKMATEGMERVFPVLVEGTERNLKWHWSKSVKQLTENLKAMLEEMEPGLYESCVQRLRNKETSAREDEARRKENWDRVEVAAARQQFLQHPRCLCVSN